MDRDVRRVVRQRSDECGGAEQEMQHQQAQLGVEVRRHGGIDRRARFRMDDAQYTESPSRSVPGARDRSTKHKVKNRAADARRRERGGLELLLEPIEIRLSEFRNLRRDHDLAIRLVGILREIILVIRLSRVVRRERRDLRDDGIVPDLGRRQLGDRLLRRRALFVASGRTPTDRYCVPMSAPWRLSVVGS